MSDDNSSAPNRHAPLPINNNKVDGDSLPNNAPIAAIPKDPAMKILASGPVMSPKNAQKTPNIARLSKELGADDVKAVVEANARSPQHIKQKKARDNNDSAIIGESPLLDIIDISP